MSDNFGVPPHRTISQVIEELQKIQAEHGDLPVCAMYEEDGGFCFDFDQVFEMVEMADDPTATEEGTPMTKICAFTWPEEPEPWLKVVKDE